MSKRKTTAAVSKNKSNRPPSSTIEKPSTATSGLNRMINWILLLVLILPLLFSRSTGDPAMLPRFIFLACFMVLFIVYFFVLRKTTVSLRFPALLKTVFILLLAYLAWTLVAAASSFNPNEAYFEIARQLLLIVVLFYFLICTAREESSLPRLCKAMLLVAVFQGMAGILQYYEIAFTEIPGANAKPYGLMANRNLFGSAQAFLLPFVIYVLYMGSRAWKYASGAALAIIVYSLLLSQTRSAWLASIAILLVSLLLVLVYSAPNGKRWLIGTAIAAAGTALIAFFILASDNEGELRASITQRSVSLLQKKSVNNDISENANERLRIWSKTIDLINDHPITGVGPGNWKLVVPSYGTEGLVWASGKYGPDRPHNVYLLAAAETGIPGALLYTGSWLLIAFIGFSLIRRNIPERQRVLLILMLAGLAGVAMDGMFSFPTERTEHSLYLLLMGGIILGYYAIPTDTSPSTNHLTPRRSLVLLSLAALVFSLFIGFKKYHFESALRKVKALEQLKRFQQMADEADRGKDPLITLGTATGISMELKRSIALKELKQYAEALKEIARAKRYHPNSPAVWNTEGTIYTDLQQYDQAIYCYQQVLKITPRYEVALKNLAVNYFAKGDYGHCVSTLAQLGPEKESYFEGLMQEASNRMKGAGK